MKEAKLPNVMREGWGVTHDYEKDSENIQKVFRALQRGETDVKGLFEKGRLMSAILLDGRKQCGV